MLAVLSDTMSVNESFGFVLTSTSYSDPSQLTIMSRIRHSSLIHRF